jgi:hypothetical protein
LASPKTVCLTSVRLEGIPEFFTLCYGANGTNFAVLAADIIRDLVLKQRNADAGLFAFER